MSNPLPFFTKSTSNDCPHCVTTSISRDFPEDTQDCKHPVRCGVFTRHPPPMVHFGSSGCLIQVWDGTPRCLPHVRSNFFFCTPSVTVASNSRVSRESVKLKFVECHLTLWEARENHSHKFWQSCGLRTLTQMRHGDLSVLQGMPLDNAAPGPFMCS